ncbi:MAG: hypothetical protein AAGA93_02695 [Actinomycetota bacterium]
MSRRPSSRVFVFLLGVLALVTAACRAEQRAPSTDRDAGQPVTAVGDGDDGAPTERIAEAGQAADPTPDPTVDGWADASVERGDESVPAATAPSMTDAEIAELEANLDELDRLLAEMESSFADD